MNNRTKIYAYFLPQFHECPYNNKWWGDGFTEWNNVRESQPIFDDHNQPRIPIKGYYNLLEDGELERQFLMANKHGIDGFVFYHYWYEGLTPLARPLDKILNDPSLNIKFSLCWANHSWTRSWKNRKGSLDVLIEQTYESDKEDRVKHYKYLSKAFSDKRYIRIDNKPLFQIYIPEDVDNLKILIDELREYYFSKYSHEVHIAGTIRSWKPSYEYLNVFDSITLAQPTLSFFSVDNIFSNNVGNVFQSKYKDSFVRNLPLSIKKILYMFQDFIPDSPTYFNYDEVWEAILKQSVHALQSNWNINLGAFVDFDNTPRYKCNSKIITSFCPEVFEKYLIEILYLCEQTKNNILFVNAWNEWGEGMYLEPDTLYCNKRLDALKNAVAKGAL